MQVGSRKLLKASRCHTGIVGGVADIISEIDEQLSEAAFGSRVVSKYGLEGGISKWLWKTLTKCLSRSCVVTQSESI
jgi:hypothetical protein